MWRLRATRRRLNHERQAIHRPDTWSLRESAWCRRCGPSGGGAQGVGEAARSHHGYHLNHGRGAEGIEREAQLELAKDLRAQWSKLTAEAQAINRKTQELLQALKEHEGTEGLMLFNFREPKCRSTTLFLQAEHCLKRAKLLEETGRDIGEWVDVPTAHSVANVWNPPWAQATTAPEPRKPFVPDRKGWPTKLPNG